MSWYITILFVPLFMVWTRLGTTATESISAAANVFLGMVRFISLLTRYFQSVTTDETYGPTITYTHYSCWLRFATQTEAPLTIKPYINSLTKSELFAVSFFLLWYITSTCVYITSLHLVMMHYIHIYLLRYITSCNDISHSHLYSTLFYIL